MEFLGHPPYISPVYVVAKKKKGLLIDFRKLSEKTNGDEYPVPNVMVTDMAPSIFRSKITNRFTNAQIKQFGYFINKKSHIKIIKDWIIN